MPPTVDPDNDAKAPSTPAECVNLITILNSYVANSDIPMQYSVCHVISLVTSDTPTMTATPTTAKYH